MVPAAHSRKFGPVSIIIIHRKRAAIRRSQALRVISELREVRVRVLVDLLDLRFHGFVVELLPRRDKLMRTGWQMLHHSVDVI